MVRKPWRRVLGVFGAAGVLLASGCLNTPGVPGGPACMARPEGGFGPVGKGGPTPPGPSGGPPGPVNLAGYNALAEYQAADLSQKLAELQDENKALLARLQGVQMLLEERERAVLSSRAEVQSATQEVARARQEITRCRQEIASLREHTRATDKESQASLQALVSVVEAMLDHAAPPNAPTREKDKDPTKPAPEVRDKGK